MSGVRQKSVMPPDLYATGMDYLLERAVRRGINSVSFGDHSYTDLGLCRRCMPARRTDGVTGAGT